LLGREPEDSFGAGIAGQDVPVGSEQNDPILHRRYNGAISCFALSQCLLGVLLVGYVACHGVNEVLVDNLLCSPLQPAVDAVFAEITILMKEYHVANVFECSDGKAIHIQAKFDKVALHDNRLVFISLVAFSQDVKALRAGLATGLDKPMRLNNATLTKDDETLKPVDVWPSQHGYRIDVHRLGFGSIHALFICREPGFLPDTDDAL
jgi:hypothetical protein